MLTGGTLIIDASSNPAPTPGFRTKGRAILHRMAAPIVVSTGSVRTAFRPLDFHPTAPI